MKHYARVVTTGTSVIKAGGATRQTLLEKLTLTATTAGTVAISDTVSTYTIDVVAGVNTPFCTQLVFEPGKDVTFTVTGPTASIFADYATK